MNPVCVAPSPRSALFFSLVRTPLLLAGTVVAGGLLAAAGQPWQAATLVSPITFTVVNVLCWWILAGRLAAEGRGFRDLLGRWRPADLGWGLLWILVLYVPFAVGLMGMAVPLAGGFDRLGELFTPTVGLSATTPVLALAAVVGLVFPFVNAPLEELYYRGYAQGAFESSGRPGLAIWVPTIGFSIQHLFVAQTQAAVPAYLTAFLLWGLTAALIRRRQRRLWPLVVAHFATNLAFSVVPVVMLLAGMGS